MYEFVFGRATSESVLLAGAIALNGYLLAAAYFYDRGWEINILYHYCLLHWLTLCLLLSKVPWHHLLSHGLPHGLHLGSNTSDLNFRKGEVLALLNHSLLSSVV